VGLGAGAIPFLTRRSAADVARLRELSAQFLAQKEFTGAKGFVITDDVAVAIAAQAVLPCCIWACVYDDFVGIVVHADEVVAKRSTMDEIGVVHDWEEVISGEAMDRGPVMLSWVDVAGARESAHEGYNVVIHEFIHKNRHARRPRGRVPAAASAGRAQGVAGNDAARVRSLPRRRRSLPSASVVRRPGSTRMALQASMNFSRSLARPTSSRREIPREHAALAQLFDGFFGARS